MDKRATRKHPVLTYSYFAARRRSAMSSSVGGLLCLLLLGKAMDLGSRTA